MSVDVSVILVNYNTAHLLEECFDCLFRSLGPIQIQVILVDNASADDSLSRLAGMTEKVTVVSNNKNVGFGRANNQALPLITGRYVLLLNTDAFVAPDTLTKTLTWMDENPESGVLGVKLTEREGGLQPSCRYFPTPLNVFLNRTGLHRFLPWVRGIDNMSWDHASVRECDWVPGCYYLIRRETLDMVDLFDPRFFMYYEEVDHCRRVKAAGWKVLFYPHTSVVHIGGESAKTTGEVTKAGRQISELQIESELLYFRKHYGRTGLALHIVLVGFGDVLVVCKQLIKWIVGRTSKPNFQSLLIRSWRLLILTSWACKSTR